MLLLCWSLNAVAADPLPCTPHDLGFGGPAKWTHVPLSRLKNDTVYAVEQLDSGPTLRASADNSASMFITRLDPAIGSDATLSWRWETDALIPGADNQDRRREDAPLRVILAFDGDRTRLPTADQNELRGASLLLGHEAPYATLMYIWSDKVPVGTVIPSAHTTRVKMIVAASGPQGLGQWQSVRKDLAADFKRAFGEAPGPLMGIGLMTDTDNTGAKATGRYADVRLTCTGG